MPASVTKNTLANLDALVKGLGDKHWIKLGIFGAKDSRNEAGGVKKGGGHTRTKVADQENDNAYLAAIHELGKPSVGIPQRSFLRMPMRVCAAEIMKEGSRGAEVLLAKGDKVTVLKRIGIAAEGAVDDAFGSRGFGSWPDNSAYTQAQKNSDTPLIDTGQLRRSVDSEVVQG